MKTNIIFVLALSVLALQCKEDEPEVVNQLALLPPATRTGEHTFGCLVNGQAWVPKTSTDMVALYESGLLQIGASVKRKGIDQKLGILLRQDILEEGVYNLLEDSLYGADFTDSSEERMNAAGTDYEGICEYEYEDLIDGTLTITHFDNENFVISGTFAFTTATDDCDTLRVTDGRFDMHYIP